MANCTEINSLKYTVPKKSESLQKNRAYHSWSKCFCLQTVYLALKPHIDHWICSNRNRLCLCADIQNSFGNCVSSKYRITFDHSNTAINFLSFQTIYSIFLHYFIDKNRLPLQCTKLLFVVVEIS